MVNFYSTLLKAHLGLLKAQSSKPQGLSASLGPRKAHFMKHAFWRFLKKYKARLGALAYFIAKKDTNH